MISRMNSTTAFKGGWQKTARTGMDSATRHQELRRAAQSAKPAATQKASLLGAAQNIFQQLRQPAPKA